MNAPINMRRGARELRGLLGEQTFDLRDLDLSGFRRWLDAHLARWRRDPVFVQWTRIRDLRRTHPDVRTLEGEHRRAVAADANSPHFTRLHELERELIGADKAVAGLTAALHTAFSEKRPSLRHKLKMFQDRRLALREEKKLLIQASPERRAVLRLTARLRRLQSAIGLDREEAELAELLRRRGRRSGQAGVSFERLALEATIGHIVPELTRRGNTPGGVCVLTGVTLGAAGVEFDQLVVRRRHGRPVEVLAAVEVKRNINDLGHGFRRRRQDLAWLTGEPGYDPEAFRTARFPSGHFDREARHEEGGEGFLFDRGSFAWFRRDPVEGAFLDRLYFVTRAGPLWGVSSAALGQIASRIATDERWDPGDDAYLAKLSRWCRSLAGAVEAPEVLKMYASAARRGRQVLLLSER